MPSSPRATILGAFLEGWRRVLHAPALALSVMGAMFLCALPLGLALRGMIAEHFGRSVAVERSVWEWDAGWADEFAAQAQGLGRPFPHEIRGVGVVGKAGAIGNVGRAALARERAVAVLGDDAATRRNENSGEGRHVDGARAIAAGTARVDTAIGERARERRRAAAHRRCGTDELVDALPFCTQCDEEAADLCGSRLAVHDLADDLGHLGAREVVLVEST